MNVGKAFKPTRGKVVVSLLPFVFPLFQIVINIQGKYGLYSFKIFGVGSFIDNTEDVLIGLFALTEIAIATPFEPLLQPLGWWSRNTIFIGPNGPLLPGSFAVAIIYTVLIYIAWSLVSNFIRSGTSAQSSA